MQCNHEVFVNPFYGQWIGDRWERPFLHFSPGLWLSLLSRLVENAMLQIHDVTIGNNAQNDVASICHGRRPKTIADERVRYLLHGALWVEADDVFDHQIAGNTSGTPWKAQGATLDPYPQKSAHPNDFSCLPNSSSDF
jgi:hypothetical protein